MADSIEIRLDQLTEAIKGLYAKSSMSQGEIYNALTSLSQRYENLTNVSSEKIAATLVNEFRKTIDIKYGQTNQFLKDLEGTLKNFMMSHSGQNPKMAAEITKLLTDTSNTYAKLNSQDLALQKIFNTIEQLRNINSSQEIAKLSENFLNFSRGFENITVTLNKNFADFLEQVKSHNSKEDFLEIRAELDTIAGNVNSVISAISIIDNKYRDLTSLIDAVHSRENIFNDALKEVKSLTNSINAMQNNIASINPKQELQAISNEIKNQIESVKYEIQKVINTASDGNFQNEVYNLTNNINGVNNNIQNLTSGISDTNNEVKNLQTTVQGLGNELKDVHNLINDEILYKSHQHEAEFQRYLNSAKEDIKTLLIGLTSFKKDLSAINEGNIKILQEPIEKAMGELKNQDLGKNIKDLADNLRDVTFEIQSSIQNMQASLNDMSSVSSMQILTQISEAIPTISDKLEIFRTHVVTENSTNLGQIKNSFSEVVSSIQENLKNAIDKIQDDTKTINIETTDTLKVDLQRLSDHLVDSVETISEKVEKEFVNFKVDFQEFSLKQSDNIEKISDKLTSLEIGLENFSNDTIDRLNDTINSNNAHSQDTLNEIKSDILEGIINIDKVNKNSLSQFELKIDKLLDNYIGADLDNIIEKKSLRETVVDIETKIDRTNLQQIHNAKELLEEIQSSASNLSMKMATIEESKNLQGVMNSISKISDKIQSIEEFNIELSDELKEIKEQIEQKLKDNVQKISSLIEKTEQEKPENEQQNSDIDNLSNKVQEYLSNFEYLKNNISQEIKENLISEFNKLESAIKKIKTSDENSNYSYTLEDVESDLTKIKLSVDKSISGNDDFKNLIEKTIELRTVALENVKINRDVEAELGHLAGWFKDAVNKIDELTDKVEDIQNIGFEDIKERLIQSEKSKATSEFNIKVENTLKHLIKYSQSQDAKIVELTKKIELLMQTQAESFNPSQFIDIFYENMTQTKMLSNRVEIIEDKINSIQNCVEKLINYVEQ